MAPKVLFSEVHGVVALHGTPVAGASVERTYVWGWNDSRGTDKAATDASGAFQFPEIVGKALMSGLPHEPSVRQTISILQGGKTYEAWVFNKRNYDRNGELNGRSLRLHCELSAEPKRTETGAQDQGYFGICELR